MIGFAKPAALLVLGASLVSLSPGGGELVKDLRVEPRTSASAGLEDHLLSGDQLFFTLNGSDHRGLWTTDGGEEGARLVRAEDVYSSVEPLSSLGDGRILFRASYEGLLHVTDGTREGTELLGRELPPEERPWSTGGPVLPLDGGRWLFAGINDVEGRELWVTDGTSEGTRLLVSVLPGEAGGILGGIAPSGSRAYFGQRIETNGPFGPGELSLWLTDGTAEGTRKVRDFGEGNSIYPLIWQGEVEPEITLVVVRSAELEWEIWRTDGTAGSTVQLAELDAGPKGSRLSATAAFGSQWLFFVETIPESFDELPTCHLWKAGASGAVKILDLDPFPVDPDLAYSVSCPSGLVPVAGGNFVFTHDDGASGRNLWVTDGTAAGTRFLLDPDPETDYGPSRLFPWRGSVVFEGRAAAGEPEKIFATDGTGTAPRLIADPERFRLLDIWGDRVLFRVFGDGGTSELWRTDGTPEGEERVASLGGFASSSSPFPLLRGRDGVLLAAYADIAEASWWNTDGTASGTVPLDVSGIEGLSVYGEIEVIGNFGYFSNGWDRIFRTDGTADGTKAVIDHASLATYQFAKVGPRFVTAGWGEDGNEPWVSDGTEAGTFQLVDAYPGEGPDPEYPDEIISNNGWPRQFTTWNQSVAFVSEGENYSDFVWITDGTPDGTRRLTPPLPTVPSYRDSVREIQPVADRLFFSRAVSGPWVTDGTLAGTRRVVDASGEPLPGTELRAYRGRCLVIGESGFWLTDGTPEGTFQLAELPEEVTRPAKVTVTGQDFYFLVSRGDVGTELWVSDGTEEGTRLVKDLFPGPESSEPKHLKAVDGQLVFTAFDAEHGREPWTSDGTEEGTHLLADVRPGPPGSDPGRLLAVKDHVVFSAFRDDVGEELFRVERSALRRSCRPEGRALCLQEGRFSVSVDWRNQRTGAFGIGTPRDHSEDTGMFWFFDEENVELLVKLLDGRARNGHFWAFAGALTDVETWVTVTDHETGVTETSHTPPRQLCGFAQTRAFDDEDPVLSSTDNFSVQGPSSSPPALRQPVQEGVERETCDPGPNALLLQDGRFAVEVDWETARQGGRSGVGTPVPGSNKSGYFWFFNEANLELVVKVLDGTASNGHFWVLYGALSDVGYEITVTDLQSCASKTYVNPEGNLCGRSDVTAF